MFPTFLPTMQFNRGPFTVTKEILISVIVLIFTVFVPDVAIAQGAAPSTPAIPTIGQGPANVIFNHRILFQLQPDGNTDAEDRADLANSRLQKAWTANYVHDVESDPVDAVVNTGQGPMIVVNGQQIVHVSEADSQAYRTPDSDLAKAWLTSIDTGFKNAIRERDPKYRKTELIQALTTAGLGLSVFVIIVYIAGRLKAKRMWSLYLAILFYVLERIINIFPDARTVVFDIWTGPLRPLMIILFLSVPAGAIARIWSLTLHGIFPPLPEHISSQDMIRRTNLRRRTLAGVAEVTGTSLIWIFAIVTGLGWWGFDPSSLLTSAGLIGVAIGLVAQDSIRDTLAGIYIFADDRYGTGDTIKVGEYEGRVERFNLRMTQIRDMSGRLITLSNRNTTEVANLTARWAQVDFRIGVSYYDDINKALETLDSVALSLAEEWPDKFLDKPEVIGVESFNDINITIRLIIRTPPGDQSAVAHELRKRAKVAFDTAGVSITNDHYRAIHP